jgi:glycosyltransferase involved in cell wall biosynthesis
MFGGVETALVSIATSPATLNHEFALFWSGDLEARLRAAGRAVQVLGAVRLSRPDLVARAQLRVARLIRRRRPSVVVSHAAWSHALVAPVAKALSVPVVYFQHGVGSALGPVDRIASVFVPERVLCNSAFVAASHRMFGGRAKSYVQYLPVHLPAVDSAAPEAVREELGLDRHAPVILIAARFESCKGHLLLAEALRRLDSTSEWTLLVAGSAQTVVEQDIERAFREALHGLRNRVEFLGYRRDVGRLLSVATVYCQPNVTPEAYGIVLVEALAAGVPVVTTSMGGALEIVDESCGVLVEPTSDSVADGLRRALSADRGASRDAVAERGRRLADPAERMHELEKHLRAAGRLA